MRALLSPCSRDESGRAKPWAGGRARFTAAVVAARRLPSGARCPGGERRTRPRTGGILLRRLPVLGAQTGCARRLALRRCATPEPLRSSAPQRRTPGHPPTTLRRTTGAAIENSPLRVWIHPPGYAPTKVHHATPNSFKRPRPPVRSEPSALEAGQVAGKAAAPSSHRARRTTRGSSLRVPGPSSRTGAGPSA